MVEVCDGFFPLPRFFPPLPLCLQMDTLDVFPKGLYIDKAMDVARAELTRECDYVVEAENQRRFKALVGDSEFFYVPDVVSELSTKAVLTTVFAQGVPLDQCASMSQETRDYVARLLLWLTLREMFEFRFMQVRVCRECESLRERCIMAVLCVLCAVLCLNPLVPLHTRRSCRPGSTLVPWCVVWPVQRCGLCSPWPCCCFPSPPPPLLLPFGRRIPTGETSCLTLSATALR
jgi:hypothetical protein